MFAVCGRKWEMQAEKNISLAATVLALRGNTET